MKGLTVTRAQGRKSMEQTQKGQSCAARDLVLPERQQKEIKLERQPGAGLWKALQSDCVWMPTPPLPMTPVRPHSTSG